MAVAQRVVTKEPRVAVWSVDCPSADDGAMPANLTFRGISIDATDVAAQARFWSEVLGWNAHPAPDGTVTLAPTDGSAYVITIRPVDTPKPGQNKIHFDLTTDSPEAMAATVQRALDAGGRLIDIGQTEADGHEVLADPEGNELCIIEPGNRFLADTGTIGAINCDGTQALGYFWSQALGWPLVWDQDEETAIQSPAGGSKITWSGPPLLPRYERDRIRFDVSTTDLDQARTALSALGATEIDASTMRDLDGNEFTLTQVPPAG